MWKNLSNMLFKNHGCYIMAFRVMPHLQGFIKISDGVKRILEKSSTTIKSFTAFCCIHRNEADKIDNIRIQFFKITVLDQKFFYFFEKILKKYSNFEKIS